MNTPAFVPRSRRSSALLTPSPSLVLQRKCACGNHTTGGDECEECDQKKGVLQRRASTAAEHAGVPPIVHEVLRGPGQPLDLATRRYMEPRFGHDFGNVRVHTGDQASRSAESVDALAFTVGDHLVFGRGQYRPNTAEGRRLLAHELAHTAQQTDGLHSKLRVGDSGDHFERDADRVAEAVLHSPESTPPGQVHPAAKVRGAAGVLQRTPAPPGYGGVAGAPDLDKIRIDAVEDFLASSLTAPRSVNVHVSDARVTHLTWMLYDPTDNAMPGGFSTLPTHPRATSEPFKLAPSHFSGPGLAPGKYILRCSGLNAQHQPVVYADRDFNVLGSDLTTGTALATTYGDLTFTRYGKTDSNPPAQPNYSIDVELRFLPKATVPCQNVTYIQSMRTIDAQGSSQQNTINAEQDARRTPLAWSIDRVAGAPSPFYIAGRDPATARSVDVAGWGRAGRGGGNAQPATLIDQPSWNRENFAYFETCAICRSGSYSGQVYGCATWGYAATAAGRVTMMPRGLQEMPSSQFEEARAAWNAWRATRPAASRPEVAPALRSP
jgi:hypothetical protein